jgi:hypothetical protein
MSPAWGWFVDNLPEVCVDSVADPMGGLVDGYRFFPFVALLEVGMVRLLTVAFLFALSLVLVSEGTSQDKKKKTGGATITGTVTAVEADKDGGGTVTVKTAEKKKKDVVVAEAKEYKIKATKDTKIEKAGEKGKDGTPAVFADIQKDQTVTVTHENNNASKIVIAAAKKKKQ